VLIHGDYYRLRFVGLTSLTSDAGFNVRRGRWTRRAAGCRMASAIIGMMALTWFAKKAGSLTTGAGGVLMRLDMLPAR
jgi:hypothetical protein